MIDFMQFHAPTKIVCGAGLLSSGEDEFRAYTGRTALLITDLVMESMGVIKTLSQTLTAAGVNIGVTFTEVPQDSDLQVVSKAAAVGRQCGANLLVAIGGGSVIDTAKAANILLTNGGDLRDYQGYQLLTEPLYPLVAIPTTIGTGSEVTPIAVIADHEEKRKLSFVERFIAPELAILDPELTHTLPAKMAAATAMDALTHAIEAYTCLEHNPLSDMYALTAITWILGDIVAGVRPDFDPDARAQLQLASTMAGVAFANSMVGGVHSLAHALGGVARVPHGVANSIVLVPMLRYNLPEIEGRLAQLARATALYGDGLDSMAADTLLTHLTEIQVNLHELTGLSTHLEEVGVSRAQFAGIADLAMEDGSVIYNPRELSVDVIMSLLESIY